MPDLPVIASSFFVGSAPSSILLSLCQCGFAHLSNCLLARASYGRRDQQCVTRHERGSVDQLRRRGYAGDDYERV